MSQMVHEDGTGGEINSSRKATTATGSGGRHQHHHHQQEEPKAEAEHHHQHQHQAFVTMLINDEFAIGAEVMLYSLREHSKVRREHVVLVTPDVSELKRRSLKPVADHIIEVQYSTAQ